MARRKFDHKLTAVVGKPNIGKKTISLPIEIQLSADPNDGGCLSRDQAFDLLNDAKLALRLVFDPSGVTDVPEQKKLSKTDRTFEVEASSKGFKVTGTKIGVSLIGIDREGFDLNDLFAMCWNTAKLEATRIGHAAKVADDDDDGDGDGDEAPLLDEAKR